MRVEQKDRLGGGLLFTDIDVHKKDLKRFKDYLIRQVNKRKIDIRLNTVADTAFLERLVPEAIIVAAGADPRILPVKGSELAYHATAAHSSGTVQNYLGAIANIKKHPISKRKLKYQTDEADLFSDDEMDGDIKPIPREDYERLIHFLQDYNPPAILPIQIDYYAGLRIGEACGLAWQDVNLKKQCLTIRQSIRYDGSRHKNIIRPTKHKKVRIVDLVIR